MQSAKSILAVMAALVAFGASAIPAVAWFESTSAATSGPGNGGVTVLTTAGGTVVCNSEDGAWQIRSAGNIHSKTGQATTKQGPHQDLSITKWNECKTEVAGLKLSVTVKPCEIQLEQPTKGSTQGTASVQTSCVMKIAISPGECTLTIPGAVENAANEHLNEVHFTKTGATSVAAISALEGLTDTVAGSCEMDGVKGGKENKLSGIAEAKGEILI
jgi:hypothetical protein